MRKYEQNRGPGRVTHTDGAKPYELTGKWKEAVVDDLRKWHAKGWTVTELKDELNAKHHCGFTRNAIVGKLDRLGLLVNKTHSKRGIRLGRKPNPNSPRSVVHKGVTATTTIRKAANPLGANVKVLLKQQPISEPNMEVQKGVPLMEASEDQCKWPIGRWDNKDMCCGQPRFKVSYTRPGNYCSSHVRESLDKTGRRGGTMIDVSKGHGRFALGARRY